MEPPVQFKTPAMAPLLPVSVPPLRLNWPLLFIVARPFNMSVFAPNEKVCVPEVPPRVRPVMVALASNVTA